MSVYFIVRDTDEQHPPIDSDDLAKRMKEIVDLIPQPLPPVKADNMLFVKKAFTLFKDCGLICKENVELLNDKQWCDANVKVNGISLPCKRLNPFGGVLRRYDLPMLDSGWRYYCPEDELRNPDDISKAATLKVKMQSKLAVICENVTYYISNDWYSNDKPYPTKQAFAVWLYGIAMLACQEIWAKQGDGTGQNLRGTNSLPEITIDRRPSHIPLDEELIVEITDELSPEADVETVDEPSPEADVETVDEPSPEADDASNVKKILASLEALHRKVDELTAQVEILNRNISRLK